jgi:hypothetical protein
MRPVCATRPVAPGSDTPRIVHVMWGLKMLWIVIALFGVAAVLVQLGALSVWVKLLSFALLVVGCVAVLGVAVFFWRRLISRS